MRALILGVVICCLPACGGPPADHGSARSPAESAPAVPAVVARPVEDAVAVPPMASPGTALSQVPAPPPDDDADGVPDSADRCPGSAQDASVDASGCDVDGDGDGVIGLADRCPNSPYGEPVDSSGCKPRLAVPQQYTLLLTFENGSAKIVGDPRAALAEAAALITQYPETTVVIEGHTDDRGPARYNMKMSRQRAEAVAGVLINDLGIDAGRVKTEGFGETKPIATNATHEGRERNRRVVAIVLPAPPPGEVVESVPPDPAAATVK